MATITTDTFLDSGTARTAGEAWTINGGILRIRTDTRWHAGAPASMSGTLGSLSSTVSNATVIVDGTAVRWMAFDTGASTVPAIGTTITQGGVSGYLLGVWASLTSAPTAVGAAMPATGFLKFRSVTSGPFSAGALTGISANASSADVVGWIEVVLDNGSSVNLTPLGNGFSATGDWFQLGTTTGTPGQIVQTPTNGGGASSACLGLSIETSPGSNVYEWYPCLHSTYFTATLLATDSRAKFVRNNTGGAAMIGYDGTANAGFTPASGCKIRYPNVLLISAASGTRSSNSLLAPASRSGISTSYSKVFLDKVACTWTPSSSLGLYDKNTEIKNSCFANFLRFGVSGSALPVLINNCCGSAVTTDNFNITLTSANNITFTDVKLCNSATLITFDRSSNITFNNLGLYNLSASRASPSTSIITATGALSTNITFTNLSILHGQVALANCQNFTFTNTDYIELPWGATQSASQISTFVFSFGTSSRNITIDGLTWGQNGALANCHPFASSGIFSGSATLGGLKIRNIGTFATPLAVGATSATWPNSIINITGIGLSESKFQRIFVENTRSAALQTAPNNSLFEQIGYSTASAINPPVISAYYKSMYFNTFASSANSRDAMWYDAFTSTTAGAITLFGAKPDTYYTDFVSLTNTTGTSGFGNTSWVLAHTTDFIIAEMPYFAKGHTSFQNVSPTVTAINITGLTNYTYQIDVGSGWNGSWKAMSAANLSAETLNPAVGFKLKIKVQATSNSNGNFFQSIMILTNSTSVAQRVFFYPLDTNTLTLTGLVAGSEVRCYTGSDPATAVEIGGIESSGTSFSFSHSSGGVLGYIRIFALGYQPVNYDPYTFAAADTSILIQQTVDRNYVNPV